VLDELGFTTSAGVSHYKILAKLGSGNWPTAGIFFWGLLPRLILKVSWLGSSVGTKKRATGALVFHGPIAEGPSVIAPCEDMYLQGLSLHAYHYFLH